MKNKLEDFQRYCEITPDMGFTISLTHEQHIAINKFIDRVCENILKAMGGDIH